ncbi:MAG: hypothetical protein AB8F95_19175 [Bacteroidia bacterium]
MLDTIPTYLSLSFVAITVLTIWLFSRAFKASRVKLIGALSIWTVAQGLAAWQGFYQETDTIPPRFIFVLGPLLAGLLFVIFSKKGNQWANMANMKALTILHIIRIPVELCLYGLFLEKAVPELMTFTGRNFDILAGFAAPIVYYFAFINKRLSNRWLLIWNIAGLLLLVSIIINAILSSPLPIQQFAFDQPNIAIIHFPFIWLACTVAPLALFSHVLAIKKLLVSKT